MGNWAEVRQRARRAVHNTFSLPATYLAPGATAEEAISCNVRLHNELKMFGDLDRELFAQVISDQNRLVIDTVEVEIVQRLATVKVYADSARTILLGTCNIKNILPKTDEFLRVEVALA
jgi:hypothetical protein